MIYIFCEALGHFIVIFCTNYISLSLLFLDIIPNTLNAKRNIVDIIRLWNTMFFISYSSKLIEL